MPRYPPRRRRPVSDSAGENVPKLKCAKIQMCQGSNVLRFKYAQTQMCPDSNVPKRQILRNLLQYCLLGCLLGQHYWGRQNISVIWVNTIILLYSTIRLYYYKSQHYWGYQNISFLRAWELCLFQYVQNRVKCIPAGREHFWSCLAGSLSSHDKRYNKFKRKNTENLYIIDALA